MQPMLFPEHIRTGSSKDNKYQIRKHAEIDRHKEFVAADFYM